MPTATLTSVSDPALTVSTGFVGYPRLVHVTDRRVRLWDNSTKPEVHRGTVDYHRWEWEILWSRAAREEAKEFIDFFLTLYRSADARFDLDMPPPTGDTEGWSHRVEVINPELLQDFQVFRTATATTLELVEVW